MVAELQKIDEINAWWWARRIFWVS